MSKITEPQPRTVSQATGAESNRLSIGTSLSGIALFAVFSTAIAAAQGIGMVTELGTNSVRVFSTTGNTIGTVGLAGASSLVDCALSDDSGFGYVSDGNQQLWVVDLSATPQLAGGTNPIPISNPGSDLHWTRDRQHLAICGDPGLVSIVDSATRTEVETFDLGHGCHAIAACADGSVLVSYADFSANEFIVRRLLLNASNQLVDTGESISTHAMNALITNNIECSPGGSTALVYHLDGLVSLQLAGMTVIDSIEDFDGGIAGALNASGDRVQMRTSTSIKTFAHDPVSGQLGDTATLTIPGTGNNFTGGPDTLAWDQNGARLIATEPDNVRFFDADTGIEMAPIAGPGSSFRGACLPAVSVLFINGFETGDTTRWSNSDLGPS